MVCCCEVAPNLDWEEREQGTHLSHHIVAGASAGMMEHVAMFPLDTIKTRMQAFSGPARTTFLEACNSIYGQHGARGFIRGAGSIAGGCIPAHIGLFTVYESMMKQLSVGKHNEAHAITPVKSAVVGATSQLVHDVILTPIDLVKQRLQLGCYKGFSDCFLTTYRQEGGKNLFRLGLMAFYRSLPVSLCQTVPSGGVFVAANETLKTWLEVDQYAEQNPDKKARSTALYFACAGLSGCFSAFVFQPLDMIKTRIQTQDILLCQAENAAAASSGASATASSSTSAPTSSSCGSCSITVERPAGAPPVYRNVFSAAGKIYQEIGFFGFWRGAIPRMAFVAPSAGLCWGTYELIKGACLKAEDQKYYGIGTWHA